MHQRFPPSEIYIGRITYGAASRLHSDRGRSSRMSEPCALGRAFGTCYAWPLHAIRLGAWHERFLFGPGIYQQIMQLQVSADRTIERHKLHSCYLLGNSSPCFFGPLFGTTTKAVAGLPSVGVKSEPFAFCKIVPGSARA